MWIINITWCCFIKNLRFIRKLQNYKTTKSQTYNNIIFTNTKNVLYELLNSCWLLFWLPYYSVETNTTYLFRYKSVNILRKFSLVKQKRRICKPNIWKGNGFAIFFRISRAKFTEIHGKCVCDTGTSVLFKIRKISFCDSSVVTFFFSIILVWNSFCHFICLCDRSQIKYNNVHQ